MHREGRRVYVSGKCVSIPSKSMSTVTGHAPAATISNGPAFHGANDAFGICPPWTNERARLACKRGGGEVTGIEMVGTRREGGGRGVPRGRREEEKRGVP